LIKLYAFLNNIFIKKDVPSLSLENRGTTFGDGLFEVLRIIKGKPVFFREHFERMQKSAAFFQIPFDFNFNEILEKVEKLVEINEISDGELYAELTRGIDKNREHRFPAGNSQATFFMLALPLRKINPANWEDGAKISLYPDLRHKLCEHKTINLLPNVLAKNFAYSKGSYEALMYRKEDNKILITEGGSSNYFCVKDSELYTPKIDNILPGVTRKKVLVDSEKIGLKIHEEKITLKFFLNSDEAFLVSTVSKVMGIRTIESREFGKPGKITRILMQKIELQINSDSDLLKEN